MVIFLTIIEGFGVVSISLLTTVLAMFRNLTKTFTKRSYSSYMKTAKAGVINSQNLELLPLRVHLLGPRQKLFGSKVVMPRL
ncbi:MAG: hypothetical protein B9J98_01165 [Candidatus Terraquivivens tikiterensis]|uniref:Uncharacterized protein n=1 Tax=Candidatus Terraquivivens tikiterensis TaxID=1980982 RepID=A0A2R7Y9M1_9ARCH|nr:MAG: hypothetical protein B9J98_01165 [Candidatus Terraquivivens tikiterensis]